MARTIAQVQADILFSIQNTPQLSALNTTSVTSIWRNLAYVVAVAIVTLENIFDRFNKEVQDKINKEKAHTRNWYQYKALAFQYGSPIIFPADDYVAWNKQIGYTQSQIDAQKIVTQCAINEQINKLYIKVAKTLNGVLAPLDVNELGAFTGYINVIKDAGVIVECVSSDADKLRLEVDVYYNPQILTANGVRIDGQSQTPVQDAVYDFLKALPFDGTFVKAHLVDAMQKVEGVIVPELLVCEAGIFSGTYYNTINVFYAPQAGYFRIYNPTTDLILNFKPYV